MVNSADIQNLLQTGHWAPGQSRSKSPKPKSKPSYNPPSPAPVRANQSAKVDRQVPRSFDRLPSANRFPPRPSVEDEADSLAKEHGSSVVSVKSVEEEPKCRGELDQQPILLEVHEFNPERRFVYVGSKNQNGDGGSGSSGSSLNGNDYPASACRKFTMPMRSAHDASAKSDLPENEGLAPRKAQRRRSELPRIETDMPSPVPSRNHSRDPSRTSSPTLQRTRSATLVEQKPPRDYFDRQDSRGPPGDGLLSPTLTPSIIKHSTKGRDRAYVDFNPGASAADGRSRGSASVAVSGNGRGGHDDRGDRRSAAGYDRAPYASEPPLHRRSSSAADIPKPSRRPSERRSEKKYYNEDGSASRSSRRNESPPRRERKVSPPSQAHSQRDQRSQRDHREKLSRGNSVRDNKGNRLSPPRDRDDYSSDEYSKSSRRSTREARDRRKSFVVQDDQNYMLSPKDNNRPPLNEKTRSRHGTPLPSPRSSQTGGFADAGPPPSPRASSTYPTSTRERRRGEERSVSPFSPGPSSPPGKTRPLGPAVDDEAPSSPRRPHDAHARMPGLHSSYSAPVAAMAGVAGAAALTSMALSPVLDPEVGPMERRRSPVPPPMSPRQNSTESNGSQAYWQPPAFVPPSQQQQKNNGYLGPDQQIVSYRRYSEDVRSGRIPDLPLCPRQTPQAGYTDWLTFPRCNNFNICPDCYNGVFARTEFLHQFVPVPFRPLDVPLACDFGSSPWYRIAWLMTRKNRLPDLQLLQKIVTVEAKSQPCPVGGQQMTRIWQTVRSPTDNRPVEDFNVCSYCATAVQLLFPNLTGTFQPVDPRAEPTKGICSLHFAPDRKRFLLYFDVLEETADRALSRGSIPDVERLYDKLRRISLASCAKDQVCYHREWYIMRSLEGFTVCPECFELVVQPEIVEKKNALAGNFYEKPQELRKASCQLYSQRMRIVFARACRKNDLVFLARKLSERQDHEMGIKNDIMRYRAANASGAYSDRIEALEREWQAWE